ncbi:MAG TPA: hypothetical protein VFW17_07200 [Ktedonobacterales bacterium]|nr:hypothetical protein [Ktedonobacterales bacterium]
MPDIHLDLDQRAIQPDDRTTTRLRQHRRLALQAGFAVCRESLSLAAIITA